MERLEACLAKRDAKLVAVGEIGLDLYREDPQFARQVSVFEAQMRLAKRYDLPAILHSRRTHDKLAMLLKKHALPRTGVVHGFAGMPSAGGAVCTTGLQDWRWWHLTYPARSRPAM